jgi:hypothetical protein
VASGNLWPGSPLVNVLAVWPGLAESGDSRVQNAQEVMVPDDIYLCIGSNGILNAIY